MRMSRSAARVLKRTETAVPVPSPKTNVVPRALVTPKFPRRTIDPNANCNNRSMGDLRLTDAIPTGTTGESFNPSPQYRQDGQPGAPSRAGQQTRINVN